MDWIRRPGRVSLEPFGYPLRHGPYGTSPTPSPGPCSWRWMCLGWTSSQCSRELGPCYRRFKQRITLTCRLPSGLCLQTQQGAARCTRMRVILPHTRRSRHFRRCYELPRTIATRSIWAGEPTQDRRHGHTSPTTQRTSRSPPSSEGILPGRRSLGATRCSSGTAPLCLHLVPLMRQ